MAYKQIADMNPWNGGRECPFCCIGCEHLKGIEYHSADDVKIECDLETEL